MQLEVHRVLHDAARRKLNVVVTGLPETAGSTSDTVKEDSEAFTKFCEENLTLNRHLPERAAPDWENVSGTNLGNYWYT